jgi:nucleotide-binding universal stress UspA family protein
MNRFRNILYLERHLEGSSRACTSAARLARINGARLTVAAVVSRDVERWEARLDEIADCAREEEVEVETRLLGGDARSALVGQVDQEGHDLLMAVAGSASGPSLSPGHPLDRALLRSLPCAVWLLAPSQSGPVRVVLAAVRLASPEPSALDRRVVEAAASLAGLTDARLHVAHFWGVVGESVLASPTRGVRRGRMENVLEGVEAEQHRRLTALVDEVAPDVDAHLTVAKGDASRGVIRLARRIQADVVVAGNSARSGLGGVLFGNLTERLLGEVHGSVLSLRDVDPASDHRAVRRPGAGRARGPEGAAGSRGGDARPGGGDRAPGAGDQQPGHGGSA